MRPGARLPGSQGQHLARASWSPGCALVAPWLRPGGVAWKRPGLISSHRLPISAPSDQSQFSYQIEKSSHRASIFSDRFDPHARNVSTRKTSTRKSSTQKTSTLNSEFISESVDPQSGVHDAVPQIWCCGKNGRAIAGSKSPGVGCHHLFSQQCDQRHQLFEQSLY